MTPWGVHDTRPGRPWASSPALAAVSPSTSFAGSITASTASWSICAGSGTSTAQDSVHLVLGVQLVDQSRAGLPWETEASSPW